MTSTSTPVLGVNKEHHPCYPVALKVYVADSPKDKCGFLVTHSNGSLPPAFSETKPFQFRSLFESADGGSKRLSGKLSDAR
jgi:hypothetical protein